MKKLGLKNEQVSHASSKSLDPIKRAKRVYGDARRIFLLANPMHEPSQQNQDRVLIVGRERRAAKNVAGAAIDRVEPDRIEQQHPAPQRTVLRWVGGNSMVCGARDMCFLVENAEWIFAVRVPHLQARVQLCKCSQRAGRTASVPGVDGGRWGLGFVHRVVQVHHL